MTSTGPSEPVITFENVRIGFDEGDILRDVSFSVAERETKVLVGESGAGKTLALKLAAGLLRPDSGRVRILGSEISAMPETDLLDFRRRVGFVFQEGALFDSMSVADNVAYRLREDRVPEEEIEQRVRQALCFVEMEEALAQFPAELSGGMKRRVSIARALVNRPPIVLYDSPTAGLDPVTSQTIITLILRLRDVQGVTSLLATQRLQDAFALANFRFDAQADRVVRAEQPAESVSNSFASTRFLVLRDGGVYFEGDQRAVLDSRDEYLQRFLI